jgi:hypothetical protein
MSADLSNQVKSVYSTPHIITKIRSSILPSRAPWLEYQRSDSRNSTQSSRMATAWGGLVGGWDWLVSTGGLQRLHNLVRLGIGGPGARHALAYSSHLAGGQHHGRQGPHRPAADLLPVAVLRSRGGRKLMLMQQRELLYIIQVDAGRNRKHTSSFPPFPPSSLHQKIAPTWSTLHTPVRCRWLAR